MIDRILDTFKANIDRADMGTPLDRVFLSGDGSKHRKKKERSELCGLCCFGHHAAQPVDDAPVFKIVEQKSEHAIVEGNDPLRLFSFFDAYRADNEKDGFTTMTMQTSTVHSRFHAIPLPGGAVTVGKYASKGGGEIFVDIPGHEIALLASRLRRDTRFIVRCVSPEEAGMRRSFSLRDFSQKTAAATSLPRVAVSAWVPWHDAILLREHFSRRGCYMFGRFAHIPYDEEHVEPEIVYVGITGERDLRTRLREFYTSAMTHATGHSGGGEFRRICVPGEHKQFMDWPLPSDTYVRVISADIPKTKLHADSVHDLEVRLLSTYTALYGHLPLCNRKWN